jgi:hypothetical protein
MTERNALATFLLVAIATTAGAQDARLQSRMDAGTYHAVRVIIDSAKKAGLPTRPIEDKALEGASAGAPGPVIVSAIRVFTVQLGTAASALGRQATIDELRAT